MKLYNDLTKQKEEFIPIDKNNIKIYSCGPTVYNFFHLGNSRPLIIFDALRRFMEFSGYTVTYVQNFTDIDDKLIKRAKEEGLTVSEVAQKYITEYFTDARGLGVKDATFSPKVSEHIPEIIEMVDTLVKKGYAYTLSGDVYFRVSAFSDYGKLSHMPLEDLVSGARIEADDTKESPLDFALWKASKEGEPSWSSPWGAGRPGWHIECSAMVKKYLGDTIDIHSGGIDLAFPHHENEIAQSEAANGAKMANFWIHNGFINIDNQKMSKSKGKVFTVRDIAKEYSYEVIRLFILSAHYRSPINYSSEILEQTKVSLARLNTCLSNLDFILNSSIEGTLSNSEKESLSRLNTLETSFVNSLADDFNTAEAMGFLFEMVREINKLAIPGSSVSKEYLVASRSIFTKLTGVLGICENTVVETDTKEIEDMIEMRKQAKLAKDFKTSDAIRDKLKNMGIILEDTPQGVKWSRG